MGRMGKGGGKGADGTSLRERRSVATGDTAAGGAGVERAGVPAPPAGEGGGGGLEVFGAFGGGLQPLNMGIDGELYNMAAYSHPGGDIIWDAHEQDATSLFYSTHPMYVWKMLKSKAFHDKYVVKQDEAITRQAIRDSGSYTFSDPFYVDCKEVVEAHLKERKEKYGKYTDGIIVALWSLSWYVIAAAAYWYCMVSAGSTSSSIQLGTLWAMAIFNL